MKFTAAAIAQLNAALWFDVIIPARPASTPVAASFMKAILGTPARRKGGVPPISPNLSLSSSWLKGRFSIRFPTGWSSARFRAFSASLRGAKSKLTMCPTLNEMGLTIVIQRATARPTRHGDYKYVCNYK